MNTINDKVVKKWSDNLGAALRGSRWYHFPLIVQHINKAVCGMPVPGVSSGLQELIKTSFAEELPFKKGIAVGAGSGGKEIRLVKAGIVESFELFEISQPRIEHGIELVKKAGLVGKINFIYDNAFEADVPANSYDFIHWNNALHHMMNVEAAVRWSEKILKPGGLFVLDDFVGPNYKQWDEETLDIGTKVLQALPEKFRANYKIPDRLLPCEMKRPDVERQKLDDPSECADSQNIIPSVKKYFPDSMIKYTGGIIYHGVFAEYLTNFDQEKDETLLRMILIIDDMCRDSGKNAYAIALAKKQ